MAYTVTYIALDLRDLILDERVKVKKGSLLHQVMYYLFNF